MFNLIELNQFVAFAKCGTLSKTSEILHISQPTLTRSMKHIEENFGANLFKRYKNKIELNDTGKLAVEYAINILNNCEKAVQAVQDYEQKLKTITVFSCAPAPLWSLLPQISSKYPERTISSKIVELDKIEDAVLNGECNIGILPYKSEEKSITDIPYISESLFICIPESNELSRCSEVTFEQLNGFNCLLRDKIGFWANLCQNKMPASRFLVQSDEFEFNELVKTSTLFNFVTNLAGLKNEALANRIIIPIVSKEANVTYHLIYKI